MGSGVRVVDLLPYLPTRDTQRTFRLRSPRAQVPSVSLQATAGASAAGPRCASCGGTGNTGDAIYEDGEWLCGGCIAGLLEEAGDI